jgi:PAS domain S-box-containing protein
MGWIQKQPETLLVEWIRRTKSPMLATLPCGEILWCNRAFEDLLGYSSVELIGKKTWRELTADQADLQSDIELVNETVKGDRVDYQLQKPYMAKSGKAKECLIDVIRYPVVGDFECFLVTVFPLDDGLQYAMGQLAQIRTLIIELMERQPSGLTFEKVRTLSKEHPVGFYVVAILLATLLFGERVVEIAKLFMGN